MEMQGNVLTIDAQLYESCIGYMTIAYGFNSVFILYRYYTCSKTMPGSLGFEEQDAKTFASWV